MGEYQDGFTGLKHVVYNMVLKSTTKKKDSMIDKKIDDKLFIRITDNGVWPIRNAIINSTDEH
jgi:hypothetical protein